MTIKKYSFILIVPLVLLLTLLLLLSNTTKANYNLVEDEYTKTVATYEEAILLEETYDISLIEYNDYGLAVFKNNSESDKILLNAGFEYNSISTIDGSPWKTTTTSTEDKYLSSQYGLTITNTISAWDSTVGSSNITIAIIDTGIDIYHEEFSGRISTLSKNVVTGVTGLSAVDDDYGHGTMVAGIIGATKDNTVGIAGITQNTVLLVIKANELGEGSFKDSSIIAGIYYAIAQGADIINLSLGSTYPNADTEKAINAATEAGIIVVGASGNDGSSDLMYPASFENVISVSALDSTKTIASYSNYNNQVDISAPGSDIITTSMDGGYMSGSGTSFAAPHVSGILSLYLSLYPDASVSEVKSKLYLTATDLGTTGVDSYYGNGLINADKLLSSTYYQISFDSSPGSFVEPMYILSGMLVSSLPSPTLINQVFLGWYTDEERSIPFDPGIIIKSDITLYALYSDSYHTVHFVTSGTSVGDLIVDHFSTFTLPTSTKAGYRFEGWYLDSEYLTQYTVSPVLTDITLYAKFEQMIYYEISYVIDGIIISNDFIEENTSFSLYQPHKTGYTFIGWYTDESYTTVFTDSTLTSNVTIYALLEIKTYEVNLVINNEITSLEVNYLDYPNLFEPTLDNLLFAGWYLDENYTQRYILSEVTSSFTIYAKFVSEAFQVTLIVNDEVYDRIYFESNETILIPMLVELGKTFDGWYVDSSLTTLFTQTSISQDLTLYASMSDAIYSIRFFNGDGSILLSQELMYGEAIVYPSSASKNSSLSINYLFTGWSETEYEVTHDLDIYPIFKPEFIESSLTIYPTLTTISTGSEFIDGGISVLDPSLRIEVINSVNTLIGGKYHVTYNIYLREEFVYQYIRYVKVIESPIDIVITLNPGIDTIYVGFPYVEAGAKSSDGTIEIIGNVNNLVPGTYIIYYQVEMGNTIYLRTRIVTVLSIDQAQVTILLYTKKEEDES